MESNTKAYLRDSEAIVGFQHSLEFFSGSVERLMDSVSDYLFDVKREMERHVALLEQAKKEAQEAEKEAKTEKDAAEEEWHRAEEARSSASFSSGGDDSGTYSWLCKMEQEAKRRYYQARDIYNQCVDALRRAEKNLEEGRDILNAFCYNESYYRADYSPVNSPGGDAFMRYVAKNDVRDSILFLQRVLEVVSSYCSCPMSLNCAGYVYDKQDNYNRPDKRTMELRREKAMADAGYRMRRERSGKIPNPDTLVRCKVCGRPFAICRCKPSILPDVNK